MKKFFVLFMVTLFGIATAGACTSAVISGKATPDGRPLLWKHRDSDYERNKLRYFHGEKFDFIGIVNSDTLESEVWMGSNSAGFSIMNTMAYNLNKGQKASVPDDQEGIFMHQALATCATLADFERLLDRSTGKRGVEANFGVIDAQGGAAYYEVGYFTSKKFDVNDPAIAPKGYLIRTNFGVSGDRESGKGYIRYATAEDLFERQRVKNDISVEFILQTPDRCLEHSLTNVNLYDVPLPEDSSSSQFVPFRDYLVRNSTVSSMVVQGVQRGEDPHFTTVWSLLGFPLTTIALPVWVAAGDSLPAMALSSDGRTSPLNERSLQLKKKCFPVTLDNGRDYLCLPVVLNRKGTGTIQKILPEEKTILSETGELLSRMRPKGVDRQAVLDHYRRLDSAIQTFYRRAFGL